MTRAKHSLRILHTADLHLGDDLYPDLPERTLLAVAGQARVEGADLVIIAGDLFDSRRAARRMLPFARTVLEDLPMPVVVLPGNHDPYLEDCVYREPAAFGCSGHVWLITQAAGEQRSFPELDLTVWGKPVIDHSPTFRPLGDIPRRANGGWHVAVAHGFHVPKGESTYRSSPIPDDEILSAGWDYLALGHVHPYRDVSLRGAIACYSGSPVRTNQLEGETGFVALVDLDATLGVSVRPVPIAP